MAGKFYGASDGDFGAINTRFGKTTKSNIRREHVASEGPVVFGPLVVSTTPFVFFEDRVVVATTRAAAGPRFQW
jgi:hypothetical protein